MADRYFSAARVTGEHATLAGSEAHHLAHVMRAKAGHEIVVFDGSGAEFRARIEKVGRAEIELAILCARRSIAKSRVALTLGVALPKGDRQRWLVEKAVELGVARVVPLVTERGVGRESAAAIERLSRSVIEASKQCGRNRLMEIAEPQTLAEFVASRPDDALRLIAEPGGASISSVLDERAENRSVPLIAVVAVGPEGGFTTAEVATARDALWQAVGLGGDILRVETAALALAAAVITRFE